MDSLDVIAKKMGTDKSSLVHGYTEHYEQYFSSLRDAEFNLLEIGIQSGASLRMWKNYFTKAQIYGYDYYDCTPFEEDRIKTFRGAQADIGALEKMCSEVGQFDIIIDDGSHKNADIVTDFEYLFPRLSPGGIYVIEDMLVTYWGDTHNVGKPTAIERMKKLVDEVMSGGKTGIGDIRKDQQDGEYLKRGDGKMTWWEKNVRFVHFYRSMVFIAKQPNLY